MTICIAAIADKKKIVGVTDRMVTIVGPVTTTYEIGNNNKAIELNGNVIAFFAGDFNQANEIFIKAKNYLAGHTYKTTREIAEVVNSAYQEHIRSILDNYFKSKIAVDFETFMKNQNAFEAGIVSQLSDQVLKFQLDVQILIAGRCKTEEEAHIFSMDNLGTVTSMDPLGYACIGSGSQHATFSLIESEVNSDNSLTESLHSLLKAKRRAEYDPGVGSLCDIVIIDEKVKRYDEVKIKSIMQVISESKLKHDQINDNLNKELEKII